VLERDLKAQKARMKASGASGNEVEMQPTRHGYHRVTRSVDQGRQRSASVASPASPTSPGMGPSGSGQAAATGASVAGTGEASGLRRSNTTGKKFEGLKRRFGSLRRKVEA
jgi:hypothetical protein